MDIHHKNKINIYALQVICILIALNRIVTLSLALMHIGVSYQEALPPVLYTTLWVLAAFGLLMMKDWGWALLLGNIFSIFLQAGHHLLFMESGVSFGLVFPASIGMIILTLLYTKSVLKAYRIDLTIGKQRPVSLVSYSIVSAFCGLFLIMEPLMFDRLTTSSILAKLFSTFIGLLLVITGVGIWLGEKLAIQSTQPVLLFVVLSGSIILIRDLFTNTAFFTISQSAFIISISLVLFIFWSIIPKQNSSK